MGCECLGPKKSQEEVFLKLIKSIHDETDRIAHDASTADLWTIINERLTKKGELRKLTENLSSRKHKIQDAMAFNYKLTTETKELGHRYIGLMIADSITQVFYPKRVPANFENNSKSDEASQTTLNKKSSQSKNSEFNSKKESAVQHYPQNSGIDEQYLKIMKLLYQQDTKLRSKILESINNFCDRHVGLISCEGELWGLVECIIEDIRRDKQEGRCCEAVKNLLLRTRDQISEKMRSRQTVQTLFMLWMNESRDGNVTSISENCFQILSIYFDRFISGWESEFLFQSIFCVTDQLQFDHRMQPLVQKLCEDLVQNSDLRRNFLRSLFNYLLGYLSISQENTTKKRWLMTSLGLRTQSIKMLYKNALAPRGVMKIEGLKRANAWIDKGYIDINQFFIYNNKAFIYVYTSILCQFQADSSTRAQVLCQFRKTLLKLTASRKIALLQTMVEEFQQSQILVEQQRSLLMLVKESIHIVEWQKSDHHEGLEFFVPVYTQYSHEKKLEVINLNSLLLDIVDFSNLTEDSIQRIAELMFTMYSNITGSGCTFSQRSQILNKHLQYLTDICEKFPSIILAYYDAIYQKYSPNSKTLSLEAQFSQLILVFSLRNFITGEPMPPRLAEAKQRIGSKNNQIEVLLELNLYFLQKDQPAELEEQGQSKNEVEERRVFNRVFSSGGIDRLESIEKKQGIMRRSNSEVYTDNSNENDRSFAEAFEIIGMR